MEKNPINTPPQTAVNFASERSFGTTLQSSIKDIFFHEDPLKIFRNQPPRVKAIRGLQYFFPILEWVPNYSLRLFQYDLLAGITIASLAIPQGISYAKLANLPPIIGLYSSFVPPLVYAVFGGSKDLAVGTVAASSLLAASIIAKQVSVVQDPNLYLHLFYTATFFTGIFQMAMGIFRLGILIEFLSRSTILGFMGGTAMLICLQQLKGIFGLKKFTTHTDIISVMHSIFSQVHEWRWESALMGVCFLAFIMFTQYVRKKQPKLFWVSALSPIVVVIIGGLIAYFLNGEKHGIYTVGPLGKGLNPLSVKYLKFDSKYLPTTLSVGLITGTIALAEGIAIGRVFAGMKNYHIDGNKEMIAFGLMNVVGSFTSCYLTTGPFSKTAVNYNAGCRTQMSNVVMSVCMMFVLLLLAPLFSHTPLVALSAIIMSAMIGLIEVKEAYHLYKVDKFDFVICMLAFFGVLFISMDVGLMISIIVSIVRALLHVARPGISKMGNIPNTTLYRDVEQYPNTNGVPCMLVLQLGSPIYFASVGYIRERIMQWIHDEQETINRTTGESLQYVVLDLSGVSAIDKPGIDMLKEVKTNADKAGIKMVLSNPRVEVTEKFVSSRFFDIVEKELIFLSVEEAIEACRFQLVKLKD